MDSEQFNIVHKEVNSHSRTIKEAMFIHVEDPTSTENWESINCHIYGTIYFRHHPPCSSSLPAFQPPPPHPPNHPLPIPIQVPPSPATHTGRGHILFLVSIQCLGLIPPQTSLNTSKVPTNYTPYISTILVSFSFLFVSLTFLTDLMKWP